MITVLNTISITECTIVLNFQREARTNKMFVNIMLGLVVALVVGIIVLVILMVAKPDIFF